MEHLDRRRLLVGSGVGLAGLGLAPAPALADGGVRRHRAAGAWRFTGVQTNPDGSEQTVHGVVGLAHGGVATVIDETTPTTALGVWEAHGSRGFEVSAQRFLFAPTGAPAGTFTIRGRARLSRNGRRWTGPAVLEVRDPAGTVIFSAPADVVGERMTVD